MKDEGILSVGGEPGHFNVIPHPGDQGKMMLQQEHH